MNARFLLDEELRTDRLILRKRNFDDNAFVFEATRYEGFNEGMPWERPDSIREMEERYYLTLSKWIDGEAFSFVIQERGKAQRIGMISIRKTERRAVWDIGYWTHPEMQNRGYMKEAARAVLALGFERLGAESIEAKYAVWNKASERVLLACGMRIVEYIERGFEKRGTWVAENRASLSREEWAGTRRSGGGPIQDRLGAGPGGA